MLELGQLETERMEPALDRLTFGSHGEGFTSGQRDGPRQEFWCQYAQAWATVKHVWELQSTQPERQALREMLATC